MIKSLATSLPLLILLSLSSISESRDRHIIAFRSPSLYPEALTWDPTTQNFIVASAPRGTFHSISTTGVVETLTSSTSNLPLKPTVLGLTVDHRRNRLIAAVNSANKPYLAAFSLHHRRDSLSLLFISPLPTDFPSSFANDVAFDPNGNAYVTNFAETLIWKVSLNGTVSVLSLDRISKYSYLGLNGVVFVDNYLLVLQSKTGKMFKVNAVNGVMTSVNLPSELSLAHGIAVREDGVVFVVSMIEVWILKSGDKWANGEVIDRIALTSEGFPSSVCVGYKGRVYVVYGYAEEGMKGNLKGQEREWFRIEEVRSTKEIDGGESGDSVWMFIMVGFGLVYFLVWRYQMRRFVKNMDKKRS